MPSDKEIAVFTLLLRYFGLYQPEALYKVVCPFHGDVNASMQISIPKAFFYCYGCNASGSSTELYQAFYKKQHNKEISALQAKLNIQKIVKKQLNSSVSSKNASPYTYDSLLTTSTNTSLLLKENYSQGITEARNYFYNIPFPCWYRPSKVKEVEEESRTCLIYMQKRGFTKKLLTNAQAKASLNKYYPIIFPLLENGIFRGYVMRTFDPEIEQQRKYMYNRGFKRESCLAGTYKHETIVLLVEGYLDCLKAQQFGIQSVVAILGWKISGIQLEKLKKAGIKHIICGTDNDEAGIKGYKYLKLVQKQQKWFKLSRVHYPKGIKDFGDLQKGTKELERMLSQLREYGLKIK